MIYIIHGNNAAKVTTQTENILKITLKTSQSKLSFDKENLDINTLKNALSSLDFFGNKPVVTINISSIDKENVQSIYDVISSYNDKPETILFSFKELTKTNPFITNTRKLSYKNIICSDFDNKEIFKFGDGVLSGNRLLAYKSMKKLLDDPIDPDPIPIIAYLQTMAKNLLILKLSGGKSSKINPYIIQKLNLIAQKTHEENLKDLLKEFYNIDKDIKLGKCSPELGLNLITEKMISCLYDKKVR